MVAEDSDGAWEGVLPLVRVKSRLFGHYLVSMPFLNYGGPLGSPRAQTALVEAARQVASRSGADLLELRTRQSTRSSLRVSHRKVTVLLDLPSSPDQLWAGLPPARRRQVRRAEKEGMEFREGMDQLEAFYDVFARNMRQLGTPVLPRDVFERIARQFESLVVLGVVYWRERPLAVGYGFTWHDEFELTWVSSLREYDRMMPNMLLYWSLMKHMVDWKVRVFNFGRCTPGGGTHRFKHQWGGTDAPLPWVQWSPRNVLATPTPDRPIYRIATSVWRRLPLGVTNRLGPPLARLIP
jgi:FemAB-related protein (PEP-CTERM system-associated)